ncbi:biotin-dependent carboxyltransferase family protein [Yeosuana marina]|uniref:5-oxoprolinase subunit C family protein n=1 Tax=Yeosuana marina TaxID=1565536 RepID=UPI0030ECAC41|tara:strand:- start:728 stop:1576 length:849 start_codon:yes stop_codon:yes gene_type:complete
MIKVLKTGLYSTIQDFGRSGYQAYGVPVSGVMDQQAAILANSLLGNPEDAPVLEMTMTGDSLEFQIDAHICITGADMSPKLNQLSLDLCKIIKVNKADILSFGTLKFGFRSYVAVLGGIKSKNIMGSASMYKGITKSYKLNKGDELSIGESNTQLIEQHASLRVDVSYIKSKDINVFKGPEFDMLSKQQQSELFSKEYTVSKNNNRMAYQLQEPLENNLEPIITSNVLPGTIQLTPSGNLIILMRDCQTTGGYPRILQLEEKSISILAQKYTNQVIRFCLVN